MTQDRSESGSAAIEFALLLPVLALLCFALIDYGQVVRLGTELRNAARAGAQYALVHSSDMTGIKSAAQNATDAPLQASDITLVTSTDGGTKTYPFYCTCDSGDPAGEVNCNTGTCTAPAVKKTYVSITATLTYTPILPYPGLPSSIPVTGSAVMQIQ